MKNTNEKPDSRTVVLLLVGVLAIASLFALTTSEDANAVDNVDTWYYDQLDDFEKKIYDASKRISNESMSSSFKHDVSAFYEEGGQELLRNHMAVAYDALKCEWTGMHITQGAMGIGLNSSGIVSIGYEHTGLYTSYLEACTEMNNVLSSFDVDTSSRYNAVKSIHDAVCDHLTYSEVIDIDRNYSLYNAVSGDNTVVCEGYAKMFKALCDMYDIPCVNVVGQAIPGTDPEGTSIGHMYNYVQMEDGNWYLVDTTWDDQSFGIVYDYFLVGSDSFGFWMKVSVDHIPGSNGLVPPSLSETAYEPPTLKIGYDLSTKTLTFSGNCAIPAGDSVYAVWNEKQTEAENIVICDGITDIGEKAFYGFSNVTSVTIGEDVQNIGSRAFAYCSSLTDITIPSNVTSIGSYAFFKCTSVSKLVTSNGLESIGAKAFYGCNGLKTVNIASTVTSIGSNAFYGCNFYDADGTTALSAVPADISGYKFTGTPSKLVLDTKFVEGFQFWKGDLKYEVTSSLSKDRQVAVVGYRTGITTLVVPDSVSTTVGDIAVTSIGEKAFYDCATLISADLGNVKSIGSKAFAYCTGLKTVTIPGSVASIGSYAFFKCTSVSKLVTSNGLESIEAKAFYGCNGLKTVTVASTVTSIGGSAFAGCIFYDADGTTVLNATPADISGYKFTGSAKALVLSTKFVEGFQFWKGDLKYEVTSSLSKDRQVAVVGYRTGITALVVPFSVSTTVGDIAVTSIGTKTFYECKTLTSIDLGSVKTVGSKAFAYCTGLKTVTIPDSVASIGSYAFFKCTSVSKLTTSSGLESIATKAFYGCNGLKTVTVASTVTSIGSNAFAGCSFYDADGKTPLQAVPEDIAGYKFTGTASKLVLATKFVEGFEFTKGGLKYQVTSALSKDRQVAVIGYTGTMTDLVVPDSVSTTAGDIAVTSIGTKAFYGCTTLAIADLGSVDAIGNRAFANCTSLTTLSTLSDIDEISGYAFYGCKKLTKVVTSGTDYRIGASAFAVCSSLKTVKILGSGADVGANAFSKCTKLTYLKLNGAETIGSKAFQYCNGMTSLTVNDGVTSIGSYAFYSCAGLQTLVIGNGVTSIGESAFASCGSLTSVDFGDAVNSIGTDAFSGHSFYSSTGKTKLSVTAKNLAGHTFSGTAAKLLMTA